MLVIYKSLQKIGVVPLFERASFTTFGRHQSNDFPILHASSSRLHAVVQYGKERVYLYDVSTHGTRVNGIQIPKEEHFHLKIGDKIQFGRSSRIYILKPDDRVLPRPDYGYQQSETNDWEEALQQTEMSVTDAVKKSHQSILQELMGGKMFV